jgi:DNA-binding HxlR family transcriptional regulator
MDDVQTLSTEQFTVCAPDIPEFSPTVETLTKELLGQIADKWTMIVLEELLVEESVRFSALRRAIPDVSQKMLTQTLRRMERLGLITRTIHPVIPPNVEYRRTALGQSLGKAVCGIWRWVETHADTMTKAQSEFDLKSA